mmetsp:Transcript_12358/g.29021  ORF Transcript_12358/g.29021 Transcript_12358/m.29021 type:complete len:98 (-) Transcript_12358:1337-1630(-)
MLGACDHLHDSTDKHSSMKKRRESPLPLLLLLLLASMSIVVVFSLLELLDDVVVLVLVLVDEELVDVVSLSVNFIRNMSSSPKGELPSSQPVVKPAK